MKKVSEKHELVHSLVLESVVEAIDDGVSVQDRDFKVLYQNKAHRKLTKGSKVGEYCYKAYAGLDSVCPCCPVEKTFHDGKSHILEKVTKRKSGDIFIEIKASPLTDLSGEVVAGIEVARNITKRREIEKELRETAKRYQMLFETAGDSIFIMNAGDKDPGRIIAANNAAAVMHGYTVPELLTMKISELDTEEAAEKIPASIKQIMSGKWVKFEVDHLRKDSTVFPVEVTAGMMEIDQIPYILAFDRDISERKQADFERENLIRELRQALENIRTLHGLLPICAWCKKVRDDSGYWKQVEDYIEEHSHATFTHGICPECLKKAAPSLYEDLAENNSIEIDLRKKKTKGEHGS